MNREEGTWERHQKGRKKEVRWFHKEEAREVEVRGDPEV